MLAPSNQRPVGWLLLLGHDHLLSNALGCVSVVGLGGGIAEAVVGGGWRPGRATGADPTALRHVVRARGAGEVLLLACPSAGLTVP